MKKICHTLFLALTLAAGAAVAGETPRQLYAPIDRIYTVEEAHSLSLYKRLMEEGVPVAALDRPGAFVETYSDTGLFGMHKLHRTAYVRPELGDNVEINTIVAVNRYDRTALVNEVVPRSITKAYECIQSSGLGGIANCAEDVVTKTKLAFQPME